MKENVAANESFLARHFELAHELFGIQVSGTGQLSAQQLREIRNAIIPAHQTTLHKYRAWCSRLKLGYQGRYAPIAWFMLEPNIKKVTVQPGLVLEEMNVEAGLAIQ